MTRPAEYDPYQDEWFGLSRTEREAKRIALDMEAEIAEMRRDFIWWIPRTSDEKKLDRALFQVLFARVEASN